MGRGRLLGFEEEADSELDSVRDEFAFAGVDCCCGSEVGSSGEDPVSRAEEDEEAKEEELPHDDKVEARAALTPLLADAASASPLRISVVSEDIESSSTQGAAWQSGQEGGGGGRGGGEEDEEEALGVSSSASAAAAASQAEEDRGAAAAKRKRIVAAAAASDASDAIPAAAKDFGSLEAAATAAAAAARRTDPLLEQVEVENENDDDGDAPILGARRPSSARPFAPQNRALSTADAFLPLPLHRELL